MDSHEYKLILKKIFELAEKNEIEAAAKLARKIDWRKEHSINILTNISKIYNKCKDYERERGILLLAYDRASQLPMVLKSLVLVCINMNDFEHAHRYYHEFLLLSKNDSYKYVLEYKLAKKEGHPIDELISILEEYGRFDHDEEMMFELAYLYHKADLIHKCINQCDDIILWFGNSEYMLRAMELKMRYAPLTSIQQEKYDIHRFDLQIKENQIKNLIDNKDKEFNISVKNFDVDNKYNTLTLQEDLQRNVREYIDDNEAIMDSKYDSKYGISNTKSSNMSNYPSLSLSDEEIEAQITGQLSLDKIFQDINKKSSDSINDIIEKGRQTTNLILDDAPNLKNIKINSKSKDVSLENEFDKDSNTNMAENETPISTNYDENIDEVIDRLYGIDEKDNELEDINELLNKKTKDLTNIYEKKNDLHSLLSSVISDFDLELDDEDEPIINKGLDKEFVPDSVDSEKLIEEERKKEKSIQKELEDEIDNTKNKDDLIDKNISKDVSEDISDNKAVNFSEINEDEEELKELSDSIKSCFGFFMNIHGFELSAKKILNYMLTNTERYICITGRNSKDRANLVTSIIHANCKSLGTLSAKLVKTDGISFNKKNVSDSLLQNKHSFIAIDNISRVKKEKIKELCNILNSNELHSTIIILDTLPNIKKLYEENEELRELFSHIISIPIFTNKELVEYAKIYAGKKGYIIDAKAEVELYNVISDIRKSSDNDFLETDDIEELIDSSIAKKKSGLAFFRRKKKDDNIIYENDFK